MIVFVSFKNKNYVKEEDNYYYEISELILKYNYDNIINGNYFIKIFPYAKVPILLFDENK